MATATLQARSFAPSLTVNDLERSIQFYTKALGFAVTDEMKQDGELRGVMLEAGGAHLGLSQDDFEKGRNRVKGVGMRLYLETDQDVTALARQAKAAGIALDSEPAPLPWGPMGFTVTDHDGFTLTIANPE
jgi:lactoylglutathione lyase